MAVAVVVVLVVAVAVEEELVAVVVARSLADSRMILEIESQRASGQG